ncbi:MAG: hypothetical protein GY743_13945 [Planctomycetaceae bacterium]|nr:hypothetical protein [Planctomycetaceae bacterium]
MEPRTTIECWSGTKWIDAWYSESFLGRSRYGPFSVALEADVDLGDWGFIVESGADLSRTPLHAEIPVLEGAPPGAYRVFHLVYHCELTATECAGHAVEIYFKIVD